MTASGLVQGVFFRASVREQALRLGLTGWVANRSDGSVEVHAQGEDDALRTLVAFVRGGPGQSRIDDVYVETVDTVAEDAGFEVR